MTRKDQSEPFRKSEKLEREKQREKAVEDIQNADKKIKHEEMAETERQDNESFDNIKLIDPLSNSDVVKLKFWAEHSGEEDSGPAQKNVRTDFQFFDGKHFGHKATDTRKIGALCALDVSQLTDTVVSGKQGGAIELLSQIFKQFAGIDSDYAFLTTAALPAFLHWALMRSVPSPSLGPHAKDSNNFKHFHASYIEDPLKRLPHCPRSFKGRQVEESLKRTELPKQAPKDLEDVPKNFSDSELDFPVKNLSISSVSELDEGEKKNLLYPSEHSQLNRTHLYLYSGNSHVHSLLVLEGKQRSIKIMSSMELDQSAALEISHPGFDGMRKPEPVDRPDSRIQSGDNINYKPGHPADYSWIDEERGIPDSFRMRKLPKQDEGMGGCDGDNIDQNAFRLPGKKRKNSDDSFPGEDWGNEEGAAGNRRQPQPDLDPLLKIAAAHIGLHQETVFTAEHPVPDDSDESTQDLFSSLSAGPPSAQAGDSTKTTQKACSDSQPSLHEDVKEYDIDESSLNSAEEEQLADTQWKHLEQFCQPVPGGQSSLLPLSEGSSDEDTNNAQAGSSDVSASGSYGVTDSHLQFESETGGSVQRSNPEESTGLEGSETCEQLVRDSSIPQSSMENTSSLETEPEGSAHRQSNKEGSAPENDLEHTGERKSVCDQLPTQDGGLCMEHGPEEQKPTSVFCTNDVAHHLSGDNLEAKSRTTYGEMFAVGQATPQPAVRETSASAASPVLQTPIQVNSPWNSGLAFSSYPDLASLSLQGSLVAVYGTCTEDSLPSAFSCQETLDATCGTNPTYAAEEQGYSIHSETQLSDNRGPFITGYQPCLSVVCQEATPCTASTEPPIASHLTMQSVPYESSYLSAQEMPGACGHQHVSQTESDTHSAPLQLPPITVHRAGDLPPWATRTARIDLSQATDREFAPLRRRRATYGDDWFDNSGIDAANMALAGFFHQEEDDAHRCFYCGVELRGLHSRNNIWDEHVRRNPNCRYLVAILGKDYIQETLSKLK